MSLSMLRNDQPVVQGISAAMDRTWFRTIRDLWTSAEWGEIFTDNLEPTPIEIGYRVRNIASAVGDEKSWIYSRTDGDSYGIYAEVTGDQADTEASFLKGIHKGHGDFAYIAGFSDGVALETASFYNGSRGFISTCQRTMPGSGTDFGNTTLFNAVWGDDGTGGSTTPALYGVFYASLSLGNSFRTRLQSSSATGFAWGRTEIAITEYALDRDRFAVYNNGITRLGSTKATALATTQAAPALQFYGSYWNGASAQDQTVLFEPAMDGSGGPSLVIKGGTAASETTWFTFGGGGMTAGVSLAMGGFDITGVDDITMSGAGSVLDMQTGDITNVDDITMSGSGSVLDMQVGTIATCGSITGWAAANPRLYNFIFDSATDVIVDSAAKGLVLKDAAGTPHYWRVTVDASGALVTTDLGTVKP